MTALAGDSRVLHLVCVGRTRDLAPLEHDADAPADPRLIRAGDLAALVADVDAREFVGPDAEKRLSDLQWLTPRALRHESFISGAMALGPVLPMRFGTVFSSERALRSALDRHAAAIDAFLLDVDGHAEHAVRVAIEPAALQTAARQRLVAANPPPASAGARYLYERRLADRLAHAQREHLDELTRLVRTRLDTLAARSITRAAHADRGDGLRTAASIALLVPRRREIELAAEIDALAGELAHSGVTLGRSGPWPPYSFCPALDPEP